MDKKRVFISVLLVFAFCVSFFAQARGVKEKASIVGEKSLMVKYFSSKNGKMPPIGAVTFMKVSNGKNRHHYLHCPKLYILGTNRLKKGPIRIYARELKNKVWSKMFWHTYVSRYGKPVIDGRDHDLNGNLVKESEDGYANEIFAVEANTREVKVKHVKLIPHKRGFDKDLDINEVIDYLKKHPDLKIEKDAVCDASGCYDKYNNKICDNLGTKNDPKIVVVDKARLDLKGKFKGYGVLIFTGERKNIPEVGFPDEIKKIKCKITARTLTDLLKEARDRFHWDFLSRSRKSLRLTMEDSASWYGVVLSDVSSIIVSLGRQTYYQYIPAPKGKGKYERIEKIMEEPFSLWDIIGGTAYASRLREKEIFPAKRKVLREPESIIIKKEETNKEKVKLPKEKIKPRKEEVKMPQIGRVRIYGAVLLKGECAAIWMNSADIFYSSEAIKLTDGLISSLPFTWEKFENEK